MPSFGTMKKSKVDYQAELEKFDWKAARQKAAIPFDASAVTKAKQLIEQATQAKLAEPYGKIGIVDGHLVFRIKYGGTKHYGKGDIVLVTDFETATAEPELSSKSRNQGLLAISQERNPLTLKWWEETLGGNNDPVQLGAHLQRFESKQAVLAETLSTQTLDAGLEALNRLDDAIRRLEDHFDAENDRRILARLRAGQKATAVYLHAKQQKYAARLRENAERLAAGVAHWGEFRLEDAARDLRAAQKALDEGQLPEAQQLMLVIEQQMKVGLQELSEGAIQFRVREWGEANDLYPGDLPMGLVERPVNEQKRKWQELMPRLEELRRRAAEIGRDAEGEDLVGEVAAFQQQLDELRRVASAAEQDINDGLYLAKGYSPTTMNGGDMFKKKDTALNEVNRFTQEYKQLLAGLEEAAKVTAPNSGTAKVLARLRQETDALAKHVSDKLKVSLARLIRAVADHPQAMAPLVKEALERGQRAEQLHEIADDHTIKARMVGLTEAEKTTILKELSDAITEVNALGGGRTDSSKYDDAPFWWYVRGNLMHDRDTTAKLNAAQKSIERTAGFLPVAKEMIEGTAPNVPVN